VLCVPLCLSLSFQLHVGGGGGAQCGGDGACSNFSSQADADSNSNVSEMGPVLWSAIETAGCGSGAGLMLCGGGSVGGGFKDGSTESGGGVQANFSAPILLTSSQPVYDAMSLMCLCAPVHVWCTLVCVRVCGASVCVHVGM
jgi:hypothetical protein